MYLTLSHKWVFTSESCHTYEWVISLVWMGHAKVSKNDSCICVTWLTWENALVRRYGDDVCVKSCICDMRKYCVEMSQCWDVSWDELRCLLTSEFSSHKWRCLGDCVEMSWWLCWDVFVIVLRCVRDCLEMSVETSWDAFSQVCLISQVEMSWWLCWDVFVRWELTCEKVLRWCLCDMRLYWLDVFVAWCICMCDMTHLWELNGGKVLGWCICDMTHSYVWNDSFICVTWLIHVCDMTHLWELTGENVLRWCICGMTLSCLMYRSMAGEGERKIERER